MKWMVGDKVMARWPGSKLYFQAVVKSIDDDDEPEVLFSNGTKMKVPLSYIFSENRFTPRRRSKSPARSRRRSRSPGRSPSRKSATSQKLGNTPKRRSRSESHGRVTEKFVTSSSDEKKVIITSSEKNVTSMKMSKTKVAVDNGGGDIHYMMTRQRTKTTVTTKVDENSSKLDPPSSPSHPVYKEYGGVVGSFLIYLTSPLLSLWLILVCIKADWTMSNFKISMIPSDLASFVNIKVAGLVVAYLLYHALLFALPLGHVIEGPPTLPNGARLQYRISARYALLVSAIMFALMAYYHVPTTYVLEHLFQFSFTMAMICYVANFLIYVSVFIFSVLSVVQNMCGALAIASVVILLYFNDFDLFSVLKPNLGIINSICFLQLEASFYVAERELNPSADTGSWIYDSFIGRIVHPRIGKLFDLKLFLYRPAMIGWILLVWISFHSEYVINDGKLSFQFLMITISQIMYIYLEFFYDENMCVFMFDIKDESLGFPQFVGELIMVPFLYSIPVRYVVAHPTDMSIPSLLFVTLLFCTGMFLVLWSLKQKCLFRKNPNNFPATDSLPSSRVNGERLLVSGLWGIVRHPNYVGEVLIALSWSLACGFTHAITWFYPLFVIGLLCDRCVRVEKRSERKHGHSWKKYCDRVKYKMLPGVF